MKAVFLLAKDPVHESTGDLTMARLVMELARESVEVGVLCLSTRPDTGRPDIIRVPKHTPNPLALARASVRSHRSLVHTRFTSDALVAAIECTEADIFVADHSYMAESFLASSRARTRRRGNPILAVNTVVSETLVWKATRGSIGLVDAHRILRDELRVARNAYSVGTYDEEEAGFYADHGVRRTHWLDLTLPPAKQVDIASSGPRLVFMGDRAWPPNREAFRLLMEWWPDIARGIRGAELRIIGSPGADGPSSALPAGVDDLGFVEDLDDFLDSCRAMIAPIRTGGGVRVKILDAARRGLPVVGTAAAVGSLGPVLDVDVCHDKSAFVERCRRYLLDRQAAVDDGDALYRRNADRWAIGAPHRAVQDWLAP